VAVADRTKEAAELLAKIPGVTKVAITEEQVAPGPSSNGSTPRASVRSVINLSFDPGAKTDPSDVPNILINQGFRLTQFTEESVNLETAFMRLTKGLVQ
jgi:hypothetical protein